jgi:tetratricopeptide (TPR) repeat protein
VNAAAQNTASRRHRARWLAALCVAMLLAVGCTSPPRDVTAELAQAAQLLDVNRDGPYRQSLKGLPEYRRTPADNRNRDLLRNGTTPPDNAKALELLHAAAKDAPKNADAQVLLGIALSYLAADQPDAEQFMHGDAEELDTPTGRELLAEAGRHFTRAVALDPQNKDAHWGLALIDSRPYLLNEPRGEARIEAAIANARGLLTLDPDNVYAQANLGIFLLQLGRADEARPIIDALAARQDIARDHPKTIEALYALGKHYAGQGEHQAAEKTLQATIARFDAGTPVREDGFQFSCPFQALGDLYTDTGRDAEALDYYLKAADIGFSEAMTALDLALKALAARHYHAAAGQAERVSFLRTNEPAMARLGKALLARGQVVRGFVHAFAGEHEAAKRQFDEAAENAPDDPGVIAGRGHLQIVAKENEAARQTLTKALAAAEANLARADEHEAYGVWVWKMAALGLGWTEANDAQHEAAVAYFDRVIAREPDDLLAQVGKVNSLIALGRQGTAESLAAKLVAKHPDDPYALAAKASVELGRGNMAAAEQGFKDAIAEGGQYTCPYEGLGLTYLRQGRIDEARRNLGAAIALNPDIQYQKFIGLAKIYLMEKRFAEAEELLDKALTNDPDNAEAAALLKRLRERGVAGD